MPIVRGEFDFEEQFTRVPNRWLRDRRLSLKAIGLLAQLHSHKPDWSVSLARLAKSNDCGIDQIRTAVRELEEYGYLERSQDRTHNLFGEAVYVTRDPSSGFPLSGFPSSENPTPKKTISKKTINKKYGDWFNEFWDAYPRKIGKATAEKAFLRLGEAGAQAVAGARRLANDPNLPPTQYIPHPTTWLNREGWLDDPYAPRDKSPEQIAEERALKSERERELSAKFLRDQEELARQSVPAPLCEHGQNIALCAKCLSKGQQ